MSIQGAGGQAPSNPSSVPLVSARRYMTNVLWTWLGVATGIFGGLFVTPYTVRKIGVDHFGMWTLVLSLVEYYWLIDIGLRSAALKFSAQYYALGQQDQLDELVNTGLAYSMGAGAILALLTIFGAPYAGHLFHISDPVFPKLIRVVGISWALGLVFNIFGACIEGFQRFDIFGRIWVSTTVLRTVTIVLILALGFGVFEMGLVLLASQTLIYLLNLYYYRRLAPQARINLSLATFSKFKEMASYGVHTLRVIVSDRLLRQAVPVMIPYYLPLRDLAFYALPMRILDYAMDGVGRVGSVTTPTATELLAKGRREELVDLSVYANRYSLAIFLPIPIFLLIYGNELYVMWMGSDIASHSAYLLPAFLFGHAIVASQMNSVSVLFGIGRHQAYSRFFWGSSSDGAGDDVGFAAFWATGRRLAGQWPYGVESWSDCWFVVMHRTQDERWHICCTGLREALPGGRGNVPWPHGAQTPGSARSDPASDSDGCVRHGRAVRSCQLFAVRLCGTSRTGEPQDACPRVPSGGRVKRARL